MIENLQNLNTSNKESLLADHHEAVEKIVKLVYVDFAGPSRTKGVLEEYKGEYGGIKHKSRHPFKNGKQQPVIILNLEFPDGVTCDVVLKRDNDSMLKKQIENKVLQELMPKVYLEVENVAVIEFIDGLELEPFQELIKDPEIFEQLKTDAFDVFDKLCESGYDCDDIEFTTGHNFIYDKDLKKFRAFDIHSIHETAGSSYRESFLNFMEKELRTRTITQETIRLFMHFIRSFLVKYPSTKLEFKGNCVMKLKPGESSFEKEWSKYKEKSRWSITDKFPIIAEVEGSFELPPNILDAAMHDDTTTFLEAYNANGEHVCTLAD